MQCLNKIRTPTSTLTPNQISNFPILQSHISMKPVAGSIYPGKKIRFYSSKLYEKNICFFINRFLFKKRSTCIKEFTFTYIVSVLIGQSCPGGKVLHSDNEFSEFMVEGSVILATIFLSYHLFKRSGNSSSRRTSKIGAEQ